ncbi:MAG TPA: peptidylprolyl isomerase [Rhodanobacteraceae bacterium]|nr:peptidylprolyl isomerase [Rhodanobacteraceae bacterium]
MNKSVSFGAAFLLTFGVAASASAQLLGADNPPGSQQENATLDRVVAVVNDDVILQSELDEAVANVQHQYAQTPGQLPPPDVLQRQVLERLILNKLQVQRANDNGVQVSNDELDAAVASVAQQNKMTVDQLQQAMAQDHVDYSSFRANLRDQLLIQRLRQQVMQDSAQVSDAEIDNMLANPAFKAGEVHLAHIDIGLPNGADADAIAKAQAKADKVEADLKSGKDFRAEAISSSDAQDALEGGDLGWRRVDELPAAFASQIDQMQPGEVSTPLRTPDGFTIVKVMEKRSADARQIVTEYHGLHIMIKPSALVSDQDAQNHINQIYHEVVDQHQDFSTLAKKDSQDPSTANIGGDMGWFMQDDWGSEIGKRVATMQPNQVSQPFKTQDGSWHLIQLLGTRQTDKTSDIQREQARQAIAVRKGTEAYQQFLRDLRSDAYIDIRLPGALGGNQSGDAATAGSSGTP